MRDNERMHTIPNIFRNNFPQSQGFYVDYNERESPLYQANIRLNYGGCKYCLKYHSNSQEKCYFVCHYCNGIHLKNNLNDESKNLNTQICPHLREIALVFQNKKAFPCDSCGGNGQYQKIVQTTHLQLKQSFQVRLRSYQQQKSQGNNNIQSPTRKIYIKKEQIKKEKCDKCNRSGKIYKMIKCCQSGCEKCKFTGIKLNPKWRQIRLQGVQNNQNFPCKICGQQAKVGDMVFELHCGHAFHKNCIFPWLYVRQGCFLCNEVDPYLESNDIPFQNLSENKHIHNIIIRKEQEKIRRQLDTMKKKVVEIQDFDQHQISDRWDIFYELKQRKENAPSKYLATIQEQKNQPSQNFGFLEQIKQEKIQRSIPVKQNSGGQSLNGDKTPWQIDDIDEQTHKWWVKMQQLLKESQKSQKSEQSSQIKEDFSF